jgi:hypothetical protein
MWIEQVKYISIFSMTFTFFFSFTKINAETSMKESNFKLKLLSTSLCYKFLSLNETYSVFINVNLDPAQTEFVSNLLSQV